MEKLFQVGDRNCAVWGKNWENVGKSLKIQEFIVFLSPHVICEDGDFDKSLGFMYNAMEIWSMMFQNAAFTWEKM